MILGSDNMRCLKCNSVVADDSNFCPYCGYSIVNNDYHNYDDPFKNIRVDTHQDQFYYQQNYSNNTKSNIDELNSKPSNNNSLLGLILGILAIPVGTWNGWVGIILSIVSLVLVITGLKYTSHKIGITSLIVTIITFILSLIVSVFILVGDIKIVYSNGYETTIKRDLFNVFESIYYENKIHGYWLDEDNHLLYLDNEGNYYLYVNSDTLIDNYYYGKYSVDEGIDLNGDEILYGDDNYYYYKITTYQNKYKENGINYEDTIDLIKGGFTFKLDKDNKNKLVLVWNANNTELEFIKH